MLNSEVFEECICINALIEDKNTAEARVRVIELLSKLQQDGNEYTPLVNHLIREVGLYPYIDVQTALWEDQVAVEAFKANVGGEVPVTLHSAQSKVLKRLLAGESIAVSAPTSFGKSFIIDAFIAIRKPDTVVIIVPTIALADETRRRIEHKFSANYKVITTTDATIGERNILIFPQERCFAYIEKLKCIDMLIVDEFYKASSMFDDSRSASLLKAMIELGKIAKQRYYLAPNIHHIADNVFTHGMQFLRLTDFKTVITKTNRVYDKYVKGTDKIEFKKTNLVEILNSDYSKTLIYAGSYSNIKEISDHLLSQLADKASHLLKDFRQWLVECYGESYSLCQLCTKGIGIHNGRIHRSLSQIQVKLFEDNDGLDTMVSTSSIIEGVNTQAEKVIVWSNKNGTHKIDYFTYRNIIGRAGRMFKYFVGKVFLLEEPPREDDTTLEIDFPETVIETLDSDNPGVEVSQEQNDKIKEYESYMESSLGKENFDNLRKLPVFKSCDSRLLRELVEKIRTNKKWPNGYEALAGHNSYKWREPIDDVIEILGNEKARLLKIAIWKMPNNWDSSMKEIFNDLQTKGYDISFEDLFTAERYLSYDLCSILNVINILKKIVYKDSIDISHFIGRASTAFLPKIVFQLEEYGMPRSISKKIQVAQLIDLENEDIEISKIIQQFNELGQDYIISNIPDILEFEKYIINYFYKGIN